MQIKDNVRKRRQARIRELMEDQPFIEEQVPLIEAADDHSPVVTPIYQEPLHPVHITRVAMSSGAEEDPELAWKEQQRMWHTQLAGDPPKSTDGDIPDWPSTGSWIQSLKIKVLVSALLFGAIWGIFQVSTPWTVKARGFIAQALSEEINFGAVAVWYEETFHGAPSFIPIFGSSDNTATKVNTSNVLYIPIQGKIVAPFTEDTKGVRIAAVTESGGNVAIRSMDAGLIKEVSQESKEGISVTIQHANQTVSVYSGLQEAAVKQNDWVQGGQQIGVLSASDEGASSQLYFAIKKGNQYIDPTEVISFD